MYYDDMGYRRRGGGDGCGLIVAIGMAFILLLGAFYFALLLIIVGLIPFAFIIWIAGMIWTGCESKRVRRITFIIAAVMCIGTFHEEYKVYEALTEPPATYVPHHVQITKGIYNEDVVKNMVGKGTQVKESVDWGVMIEEPNRNAARQEFNRLYAEAQARHLNLAKMPNISFYRAKYKLKHNLNNTQTSEQMFGKHIQHGYKQVDTCIARGTFKGHVFDDNSDNDMTISNLAQRNTSVNRTRDKLIDLKNHL